MDWFSVGIVRLLQGLNWDDDSVVYFKATNHSSILAIKAYLVPADIGNIWKVIRRL